MPLVSAASMKALRRAVTPDTLVTVAAERTLRRLRTLLTEASGSLAASPRKVSPGLTVSRLVPSSLSSATSPALLESEMPSTATIAAMPIATPSADSAARRRRVRRPTLATRSTSAGSRRLGAMSSPIVDHAAVAQLHAPGQRGGDLAVVGDHQHGCAVLVERSQQ